MTVLMMENNLNPFFPGYLFVVANLGLICFIKITKQARNVQTAQLCLSLIISNY